jgi:hypothetical protein
MNDNRIETKFLINSWSEKKFQQIIKCLPFNIVEKYSQRQVNNIYLDTFKKDNLLDHLDGINKRYKCRIRWYGKFNSFYNPYLEFKIKHNKIIKKKKLKLIFPKNKKFPKSKNELYKIITNSLKKVSFVNFVDNYEIARIITYKRQYLESKSHKIRFTIDKQIKYKTWKVSSVIARFEDKILNKEFKIIEVKHGVDQKNLIPVIIKNFQLKPESYSKFVSYRY